MRRLSGVWLLFLLVFSLKSSRLIPLLDRPLSWRPAAPPVSTAAQVAVENSPGRVAPVPPAAYRSNPLFFFSTAPRDSLILIPGIGPVLADRIINARAGKRLFNDWDDLLGVKGIGAKKVEKFKSWAIEN